MYFSKQAYIMYLGYGLDDGVETRQIPCLQKTLLTETQVQSH